MRKVAEECVTREARHGEELEEAKRVADKAKTDAAETLALREAELRMRDQTIERLVAERDMAVSEAVCAGDVLEVSETVRFCLTCCGFFVPLQLKAALVPCLLMGTNKLCELPGTSLPCANEFFRPGRARHTISCPKDGGCC